MGMPFTARRFSVDEYDRMGRAGVFHEDDRMELLEMIMRRQIEHSIIQRDEGIEIAVAQNGGETNSETQPWVTLGLFGHPCD